MHPRDHDADGSASGRHADEIHEMDVEEEVDDRWMKRCLKIILK